ncbi:GspH/FimT family pseudopilin [Dyella humi]|uniref:Type II secretion system protein H n=1 Tax=Dyella humi TaxID=1770547 RepID=A0ABW8IHC3_9GAMM
MGMLRAQRMATGGFSVIELLVVLAIAAIIMAYAIPAYKNMIIQYRMSGEINDLQTDIEIARSSAIRSGTNVTICPSPTPAASVPTCGASTNSQWNTGWIIFTDTSTTVDQQSYQPQNGDTLLRIHNALQSTDTVTSSSTDAGVTVSSLTFNRMGGTGSLGSTPASPPTGWLVLNDATNDAGMIRCLSIGVSGTMAAYTPQSTATNGGGAQCP